MLIAVVAVFAITLIFRPLSLHTLLTNPLFAIGFGAPLVLYLSALLIGGRASRPPWPPWKEWLALAALGVVLSLLILQQWIIGFGLASTILLGIRALRRDREALLFLLPSLIALFFTLDVSLFLGIISTIPEITYDALAYAGDAAFGTPVSFRVGQLFAAVPILGAICTGIYLAPPPGLIFVYALEAKSKTPPRVDIVTALLTMGAVGYVLYFLFPACGPKFVFPQFPNDPPDAALLAGTLMRAPYAPRNAVPSLHMASALIAFLHARRFGRVATIAAGVFVAGTFLGTMGTGEHYFVDLVVALPFTLAMHALFERRFRDAIAPVVIFFAWLWTLRFHNRFLLDTPWLAWSLLALTLIPWQRLQNSAFAPSSSTP